MKLRPDRNNFPLFLLLIVLLAAALFIFMKPKEPSAASGAAISTASEADQKLQKFNLTGFDDKGKKFWNLQGDTAKIDLGEKVYLEDNVTLKLKDGTVIRTDHVQWSQDGGMLTTKAPVFVKRDDTRVKGRGAFGKLSENFIQLNRDIEMILTPTATLTCYGPMKIFYNENKMVFYRRVKISDEKGVLTSNRMDVYFDPNEKLAKEVVATGDVMIQRQQDTTRSQRAIYTPSTGSLRLEGSPEITIQNNESDLLNVST